MKTWPTLFKKTSTGADQSWEISTEGATIVTRWGQVGGKIQEGRDLIKTGKNIGKKNETTPELQAELEAQSQWEKKLKKAYVQDLNAARAGKTDDLIEGGIFPMLAHKYSEQGHKIVFPAAVQPKFDGHRCIAMIKGGIATLWTRTRKPITGLPHIVEALEQWACFEGVTDLTLDGELYNHEYRTKFEELSSFIRTPEAKPGHEVVQYHIYDVVADDLAQFDRLEELRNFFARNRFKDTLVFVETVEVADEDDMMLAFERFLAQGYEGLMVRNLGGLYVNKRSYDLQKVKEFDSAEYPVIAVEEGRGKLAGHEEEH